MTLLAFCLALQIVGGQFFYTVQPGDSLTSVAARYGVEVRVLAEANGLDPASWLNIGDSLFIDNRHLAPPAVVDGIVINVPQRMLFYYRDGAFLRGYPIAVGSRGWRTPLADFTVVSMERDPVWDVPVSIQQEMRSMGKPVVTRVPPSPDNPLGRYWIGLSLPAIGIHGTNAPSSIYKAQTHGCIRLHPEDIHDLYGLVEVGLPGRIIYEPVLMDRIGDRVLLEAHPDVYRRSGPALERAQSLAAGGGFADMVDWDRVQDVLRRRDGVARDVTLGAR